MDGLFLSFLVSYIQLLLLFFFLFVCLLLPGSADIIMRPELSHAVKTASYTWITISTAWELGL